VTRDPLDERCAELFAAARREPAPEATRQRIAAALRAQPHRATRAESRRASWPRVRFTFIVAAAALVAAVILWMRTPAAPVHITAEAPTPITVKESAAETNAVEKSAVEKSAVEKGAVEKSAGAPVLAAPVTTPEPAVQRARARAPASLEQELASMQHARAALGRGDAPGALAELDEFGHSHGWRQLAVEAQLLRIEALAQAGRADEARDLARRFVEQNPNNPLVDRARTFAAPASPSGATGPIKGNQE
jgi:hypothetical protein